MSVEESRDSPLDERKLLQLAAAGDERAFRTIVRTHSPAVAAIITSMLGPGDDADDAGQETFIRLMRALRTFRGDASIRTFVTRIAMNVSLDALARRKRNLRFVSLGSTEDTATGNIPSTDGAVDEVHEFQARTRLVQQAVDTLDAKHRA
ncbi:MAG: sigma-70 family RNA polymerase sigma factor, partial [Gemmatimonadaceae bacterium]